MHGQALILWQKQFLMKNSKKQLILVLSFILGVILITTFDFRLQKLIRNIYKFSLDGNINFFGKYFYLFPSKKIILIFGFISLIFSFLNLKTITQIIKSLALFFAVFFFTVFLISYIDAKIVLVNCTKCDDGILNMRVRSINYDLILILSGLMGLIPSIVLCLKRKKI